LINPKTKEVKDIDMDFKKRIRVMTFSRLRTNKITLMNKSSCSNMRMIDREKTCCRKVNQSEGRYVYNVKVCGKAAPYTNNGTHFYCRQHSKIGRFVIRNGNVGEILARFNTEEQVRAAFPDYPGMRMQKITPSHRKDIH
jgi:hypothetical protein